MLTLIGYALVFGAVLGGFLMEGGAVAVLLQPAEFVIILGAAIGGLIASAPTKTLVNIISAVMKAVFGSGNNRASYINLLLMLYETFLAMRKGGDMALEKDVDEPSSSAIFSKYPAFLANPAATGLLCDSLRMVISGAANPDELDHLMDEEIETFEDDNHEPISLVTKTADALPGLGIVAAVLGIVITMGHMDEGPEAIGHSVAAALVGTFLGILCCYGVLQPLATKMEVIAQEEAKYLKCIKTALVAHLHGSAPVISVEYARRAIPGGSRPTASELEEECRGMKAKAQEG